jgi:shikimate kinase
MKDTSKRFRNIILTGMPGSGKSTFAKTYAIYSGRYYLDFDKYLESVTKKKIHDIFNKEGEQAFRALEEKILKKLEKKHNYVIAMGGGTLCNADNFEFARKLGLIVYLCAAPETIARRIAQDEALKLPVRPMFSGLKTPEDVLTRINEIWDERKEYYEKAYIHLNTDFGSIDNLKLQLGLYEKKSAQREQYKEKT